MARVTEDQILAALKVVEDPDKGQDIVSLGMVSGLVVKDGNVGFAIEVDPKRGPQLEPLRQAAEKAVDALPHTAPAARAGAARHSRHRKPHSPGHKPPQVVRKRARHRTHKKPWSPASSRSLPLLPAKAASANPPPPLTSPSR